MHCQNKQKWIKVNEHQNRFKLVNYEVSLEAVAYVGSLGFGKEPLILFEIVF